MSIFNRLSGHKTYPFPPTDAAIRAKNADEASEAKDRSAFVVRKLTDLAVHRVRTELKADPRVTRVKVLRHREGVDSSDQDERARVAVGDWKRPLLRRNPGGASNGYHLKHDWLSLVDTDPRTKADLEKSVVNALSQLGLDAKWEEHGDPYTSHFIVELTPRGALKGSTSAWDEGA